MNRDDELRAVAEAATPGPWEWNPPSGDSWPQGDESLMTAYVPEGEQYRQSVLCGWGYDASGIDGSDEDRAFIAAASPDVVLALLDRLAAAEVSVGRVRALADEWARTAAGFSGTFAEVDGEHAGAVRAALAGNPDVVRGDGE